MTSPLDSRYLDVGYVAKPGEDFASTGPHLDVRVLKDGKYIDPGTIRSLLTRLKVGKERTPLWQQKGTKWEPTAPITSGFGPRTAPTAGASSYHPAHDYGLSAGTPLTWEGPGSFTPGKGYGTIATTDPQGNPYEIRLLHTKGGKQTELKNNATPELKNNAAIGQQALNKGNTFIFIGDNVPDNKPISVEDFVKNYAKQVALSSLRSSGEIPVPKFDYKNALLQALGFNEPPPEYG